MFSQSLLYRVIKSRDCVVKGTATFSQSMASSQAKDTDSTLFVTYPWPLASLKIKAPAAPPIKKTTKSRVTLADVTSDQSKCS